MGGAKALSVALSAGDLSDLETLDLSDNAIGEEGGKAIAEAISSQDEQTRHFHVAKLKSLDVSDNALGKEGGKAIAEAIGSQDEAPPSGGAAERPRSVVAILGMAHLNGVGQLLADSDGEIVKTRVVA